MMCCTVQPHPRSILNQKRIRRISTVRHRTQHYGRVHDSRTSESSLVVDDLSHLATISPGLEAIIIAGEDRDMCL